MQSRDHLIIIQFKLRSQGGELWEQFRQYEDTLLQTIKEQLDQEDCPEREFVQDLYNKQRSRVDALFQRQLAVPLTGKVIICCLKFLIISVLPLFSAFTG